MEKNEADLGVTKIPKYGLKLKLDHSYPEKKKQDVDTSFKQVMEMLPMMIRYLHYYVNLKRIGRKPNMDYIKMISGLQIYGCPLGGIGTGTIGRGYKGEFCRFQLRPGLYEYKTIHQNQFIISIRDESNKNIFQSVLSAYEKPKHAPEGWEWNLDGSKCDYSALYPRAWTEYDLSKYGVKLICRQISPIIPHNYKDSSLPCSVFVWDIENVGDSQRSVSISFTWSQTKRLKKKRTGAVNFERYCDEHSYGITMEQNISSMPCIFTIAKAKQPNDNINEGFCKFNSRKNSKEVWQSLLDNGKLSPDETQSDIRKNNTMGISGETKLNARETNTMEFCLVWDMPNVRFSNKTKSYKRFYTRYFGNDGVAGPGIATYALKNYKKWEKEIYEWQSPIMENKELPDWYKSAIMNELYYISDGGTVWFDVADQYPMNDPRATFGLFGYLEGHEYRMYNTYDVHFYASFALAMLWPNLQVSLQYAYKDSISAEINIYRNLLYNADTVKRKVANSVPHDMGDPDEEPFLLINSYNVHDVSEWRDLNPKFILQVFRDFTLLRRAASQTFASDRYGSLEYIDEANDANDDLYTRSVYPVIKRGSAVYRKANSAPEPKSRVSENGFISNVRRKASDEAQDKRGNGRCDANNILDYFYHNNSPKPPFLRQYSRYSGRSVPGDNCSPQRAAPYNAGTYLQDMYPACRTLVRVMTSWDKDGDGLIENSGFPDQTFDAWVMTGPSAYCGSLYLAALFVMINMAKILGKLDDAHEYETLLEKGKQSFQTKLWTGEHYLFDSNPQNKHVVMADQLCGQWYLRSCGFQHEIFPKENVSSALDVIYKNNVKGFYDGKLGACNGYIMSHSNKAGHIDTSSVASAECWTGVTYGLASLMLYEGKIAEAFDMAGSMYQTMSQSFGLNFETPEAFNDQGNYRSLGYMRPLSIWAMQHAINTKLD